jgi:hypothetical protein
MMLLRWLNYKISFMDKKMKQRSELLIYSKNVEVLAKLYFVFPNLSKTQHSFGNLNFKGPGLCLKKNVLVDNVRIRE